MNKVKPDFFHRTAFKEFWIGNLKKQFGILLCLTEIFGEMDEEK